MRREWIKTSLVGLPEAVVVLLPLAGGLLALSPAWTGGVLWGLAAVAAGRLVGALFLTALPRQRRAGLAVGLMGLARQLLVAALALGGIAFGLAPLGVCLGLLAPSIALWARTLILRKAPC